MALQAAYQQYLATPNSSFLAENASLHYITTLTTFHGPAEIIKHLNTQTKKIKKKSEKVLDVVDGTSSLALETELTVEFLTGGGAYLPGIDDNFLADREVTFLVVCPSVDYTYCCTCANELGCLDPHCLFRCERQNNSNPTELGSGFTPEVDRCDREDWAKLAYT